MPLKIELTPEEFHHHVEVSAYYHYLKRISSGIVGTADLDWDIGEMEISEDYTVA
jgi:hypothetical protein